MPSKRKLFEAASSPLSNAFESTKSHQLVMRKTRLLGAVV